MQYILGTRGSDLAIAQTLEVSRALSRLFSNDRFPHEVVKTLGDKKQGTPEAGRGDKRDWIHELELALLAGDIDLAVHSGKDIPVDVHNETVLVPVLLREFPGDVFIGKRDDAGNRKRFSELKAGDLVGTASKRRQAQLLRNVPGLRVIDHRGNVPTRLQKLEDSEELAGIVLARAGLERLGLFEGDMDQIPYASMLPAVNQGILAVQCRQTDLELIKKLQALTNPDIAACFDAERACISVLEADCHSAVSAFAEPVSEGELSLCARVFSLDGEEMVESIVRSSFENAVSRGQAAGVELQQQGADKLLADARIAGNSR